MELSEKKAAQRREVLRRRNAMAAAQRQEKSRRLCGHIADTPQYRRAGSLLLFAAFGSEAELSALAARAREEGKHVLYPLCLPERGLLALEPGPQTVWERDAYGIPVPRREDCRAWAAEALDLVLCPCAGFDAAGRRLGMGGGYYDRYLLRCRRAVRLLAAFEEQRLERVWTEARDLPMDLICTDAGVFLPGEG